jgi:hypothetical protein
MGVQKHYKKRFTKKIVSKSFYKKFDQKSKTDFFSNSFLSRFWAFLDEVSSKTRQKKYRQNKSDPSPFSYSDPPTHHGGRGLPDFRLFFCAGPLGALGAGRCRGRGRGAMPALHTLFQKRGARRDWGGPAGYYKNAGSEKLGGRGAAKNDRRWAPGKPEAPD